MSEEVKTTFLIGELNDLDLVNYHLDGFVVPIKSFASYATRFFDLDEARIIASYCLNNNIIRIAKVDKIIENDELDSLHHTLDELLKMEYDYFMCTDMAVLAYFKNKNMLNKIIYSSSKMIASLNEASYYVNQGIIPVPSSEISYDELKDICKLDNICLTVYGYLDIFYSKRKLLSLFNDYQGKKAPFTFKNSYKIKEESRNEFNEILENENGSFIFSDFIYMIYRELNELKPKFLKINSYNIPKANLFKIIDIYQEAIEKGPTIANYNSLLDIDGKVGSGFLYVKANILDE